VIDLLVRDVRLRDAATGQTDAVDVQVEGGRIVAIERADPAAEPQAAREVVDGDGAWLTRPYVEPHVHLDAALTAGQPRWNRSGTLWEGIACWSERKPMLTRDDVVSRAEQTLRW
jgi:cytosine deaminase